MARMVDGIARFVTGAQHEDMFWSWPLIEDIFSFIKENI